MAGRLGIISAPVMGGKKKSLPVYDRYVNTVTGSDGNDGLSMATAWKTPDYASAMMSAAQTLGIVAPATSPIRNGFAPATAGLICGGLTSARRAYIAGTVDVSQGKACENLIFNGNCEGWLSASSMWGANLSAGNPIARSEEKHSGKYSIDATRTSSTMYIEFYVYLPANTEVTLTYWHKDATVNARWRYLVREVLATSNYLQENGSWVTSSYTH